MLIYHPAFDAYHCVVRLLRLLTHLNSCEIQRARILDFFIAFPSCIAEVRLPRGNPQVKRIAKSLSNPYHDPVNPKQAFREMEHIQLAAIRCLAGAGIIETDALRLGILKSSEKPIPPSLNPDAQLLANETLTTYFLKTLASLPLTGPNGLKDRSGLLDHRYDTP